VIKSNVQKFAKAKGIKTPQDLSHELRVSWSTAKQVWDGDVSNTRLSTMHKLAVLFDCRVDDLYYAEGVIDNHSMSVG
jgi:DNA-binding Xre family transcriptional regulator